MEKLTDAREKGQWIFDIYIWNSSNESIWLSSLFTLLSCFLFR